MKKTHSALYFWGTSVTGAVKASDARNFLELAQQHLTVPQILPITREAYSAMDDQKRKAEKKKLPYLTACVFKRSPSRRNFPSAGECNLIMLDLDMEKNGNCPAARFVTDPALLEELLSPFDFVAYFTVSSTTAAPRIRIIVSAKGIPLKRYPEAVQAIADRIGLTVVTHESKTAVQPMFVPAVFSDEAGGLPIFAQHLDGRAFEISDIVRGIESQVPPGISPAEPEVADASELEFLRPTDPLFTLAVAKKTLREIDPDIDYTSWINVAAALKHQFCPQHEEAAYQLFDEWSSKGSKYNGSEETEEKWNSLKQTPTGRAPITCRTLLKMAEESRAAQKREDGALDLEVCLIPASDLESKVIPKRKCLVAPWLCEADLGYIFAGRGVGKTWLAMGLPRAISKGEPFGRWGAGEGGVKVLYVDGEMPLELTQYRSRALKLGDCDVTYLHHETLFELLGCNLNIALPDHRAAMTTAILNQGFKCIIFDNLSALASGIDENKGNEYEALGHWFLELRRRKITVIVIHHASRTGTMRGHSKREDACSWILELIDDKKEGEPGAKFISHFAKPSRNTGDAMPDLLWHFITDDSGTASISCEVATTGEYERFIQHVLDGVETQKDIAEMMGKPKGTISKWAKKAVGEGRIRRDGPKLVPPSDSTDLPDVDEVEV